MAMISDACYALHAIRLSALRTTDDPLTPRIITLDPAFGANPYVSAMGLGDIDRWPEIKRALDSPPPDPPEREPGDTDASAGEEGGRRRGGGATGLRYTQTIVPGGRTGAAGMRVSGRRVDGSEIRRLRAGAQRSNSSSHDNRPPVPSRSRDRPAPGMSVAEDVFTAAPPRRQRSDSAPVSAPITPVVESADEHDLGGPIHETPDTLARSMSTTDDGITVDTHAGLQVAPSILIGSIAMAGTLAYNPGSSMGVAASQLPSDLAMTQADTDPLDEALAGEAVDEGSDVGDDEVMDEEDDVSAAPLMGVAPGLGRRPSLGPDHAHHLPKRTHGGDAAHRVSVIHEEGERRSSTDTMEEPKLEFAKLAVASTRPPASSLTASLNHHVPHLVSTGAGVEGEEGVAATGLANPFASLYASVAAPSTVPSLKLQIYFPHSNEPTEPILLTVRKDATVEEVTGHGLWKYWEEGLEPQLEDEAEQSTVGWGLRIVEDDGEVDEDFPALDRESQIAKFSYGEFAIVQATDSQKKQNAAMAPLIQRRPSRIIQQIQPPQLTGRPGAQAAAAAAAAIAAKRPGAIPASPDDINMPLATPDLPLPPGVANKQVLLRVHVSASADEHYTTTINVSNDTYIADITEVLVQKKHLVMPPSEWVLCLGDLTLALPLDRTVASLEGKTDLALVRRQWAIEHGLQPPGNQGGDPNAGLYNKRQSEASPYNRFGAGGDFGQTYKKWTVQRKTPIGRHERVLAIDGDYIYIMPSENRGFFDTMKETSFHITSVMSCKLSGRAGGFKIYVLREGNRKRYEFEADNGKQANEIIASVKQLMKTFQAERNSVLAPMRTMSRSGARRR